MAAPLTIEIGGTPWVTLTQQDLEFTNTLGTTLPTLIATIYDANSGLAIPQMAQDVLVTETVTGKKLWGGILSYCTGRTEGISRYWDIQAQGYAVLLQKTLVFNSFGPGFTYLKSGVTYTGDLAVLMALFETSIYGENGANSTASEIKVSPTYCQQGAILLSSLNFIFQYLGEAVNLLTNYVGFDSYVDADKYLHYYYLPGNTAPFALSSPDKTTLSGLTCVQYRNLRWKRDASRLSNNFVVVGGNAPTFTQDRILSNNGVKTVISTNVIGQNYPIGAPPGSSTILVSVNTGTNASPVWTPQTVGIMNTDPLSSKDCLFDVTNQTLTFNTAPPNFANSVKIWFVFTYAAGQPYPNAVSIATYGQVFSQRLIASDANSAVTMQALLTHMDQQYSEPLEILTLSLADTDFPAGNTTRFEVGQYVPFHNQVLNITSSYYIHSIKTTVLGGAIREYSVELRSFTI